MTHLARKLAGKVLDGPARVLGSIFGNGKSSAQYRDHKRASGHLEHGRRYYNKKKYVKAEEYFRSAVMEDAGYALAHYYLGLALYKQDLSDKAIGCWTRAAKAEPGSDAALKAQKKLEFVRKHMNQVIDQLESQIRQE